MPDPVDRLVDHAIGTGGLTRKQVDFALLWVQAGRPTARLLLRDVAKDAGYSKPTRDGPQMASDPKVIEFAAQVCALTRGTALDRVSRAQAPMSVEDFRVSLLHGLDTILRFDSSQLLNGNAPRPLSEIPEDIRWCVAVKTKVSKGGRENSADIDAVECLGPKLSERLTAARMMMEIMGIPEATKDAGDAAVFTVIELPANGRVPGGHAGRALDS